MAVMKKAKSAFPTIVQDFGYSPIAPAIWRINKDLDLECRDLSLKSASGEVLDGRHWRAGGVARSVSFIEPGASFAFIFVLKGEVTLKEPGNRNVLLKKYSSATRIGGGAPVSWDLSPDAELIEISGGERMKKNLGALNVKNAQWLFSHDAPDSYHVGQGPRRFFKYRDLGTSEPSGRRIHIHVVAAASDDVPGGTGWHWHTMGQLFYVLEGWADLAVEKQPWLRMHGGDAMCICAGMAHNVPVFSSDYVVLEMCIPADYDTVDAPKPV